MEDTEACDVRNREVRLEHSGNEGSEQGSDAAELLEQRPRPEGKLGDPTTRHTLRWESMPHGIKQLRQIDCRHALLRCALSITTKTISDYERKQSLITIQNNHFGPANRSIFGA